MRRILRKIAEGETQNLGDTTTLLDPGVVEDIKNGKVTFDAEIGLGKLGGGPEGSTEIIVHLSDKKTSIRVSITWGKQPKEIEAIVYLALTKFRETGPVKTEYKIMRARFLSNPEVLKDTNINHIKAVKGLQVIESATDDQGFVTDKSALQCEQLSCA